MTWVIIYSIIIYYFKNRKLNERLGIRIFSFGVEELLLVGYANLSKILHIRFISSFQYYIISIILSVSYVTIFTTFTDTWPKTRHGLPSTSGTTVSVVIVRGKKLYIAHVGDSSIALGTKSTKLSGRIDAVALTHDHKPEEPSEKLRIEACGGKVLQRNGISRVAWKRPVCFNHKGPMRRSTKTESVPFLAVSRSLGKTLLFSLVINIRAVLYILENPRQQVRPI